MNLGSIKVFNQNVDAETAEEIVTMAYENGQCNLHIVVRTIINIRFLYTFCKVIENSIYTIIGINYFDICDPSGTDRAEQEIGRIVRKKGWDRRSYVISTRVYWHR